MEKSLRIYKRRLGLFLFLLVLIISGVFLAKIGHWPIKIGGGGDQPEVLAPTIINGELVLPKVGTGSGELADLGKAVPTRLGVISANLIPIMGKDQNGTSSQLSGIRILGEMGDSGNKVVTDFSPVIRFLDAGGKTIGQKVGRLSTGWDFFGVGPNEKTLYDVTVDNPPTADRLEIVLNVAVASEAAVFEPLKIASRSVEVKTATYQGDASNSAQQSVEYYSMSGQVVNALSDPVSDISVYAWVKDKEAKVFAFARQDFKNDLLAPGEKIDFRMTLLPLKANETYDSYEISAWGKRYRLNL